ncbi:MAG: hypothetical protein PHI41_09945 [Erysipelotrichaceae bacterium]|nr:hypothetical protein [Erysipelotrichaceae bacterium]MDD3810595.1 hypothetical protein [Erysipelotrichaceae bacterium]
MAYGIFLFIVSLIGIFYGFQKNEHNIPSIVLFLMVIVVGAYFYFNPY